MYYALLPCISIRGASIAPGKGPRKYKICRSGDTDWNECQPVFFTGGDVSAKFIDTA